jgi:hypothetical protein
LAASTLGIYAGLVALEHGVFEIMQGSAAPDGVLISAIGPPCQAEAVWHACLPALTVVPSFLAAGALTVVLSLAAVIWSIGFVQRKHGGPVLILLSLVLLLVGGGFVGACTGLIAGAAGTRIAKPSSGWWRRLPDRTLRVLVALWPWTLVAVTVWFPGGWILGHFFGRAMLIVSGLLFVVFDLGLPVLTVLSGLARDARRAVSGQLQPDCESVRPPTTYS